MLHIYHGNGKGKTTAAVGLAIRAAGAGMNVAFFQFLKDGSSSEINILKQIKNITAEYCTECSKFTFQMSDNEKKAVAARHSAMINTALSLVKSKSADMIILDEFLDAYNKKMLDITAAESLIFGENNNIEIILTGREPSLEFIMHADYISEISSVKHPYQLGITARKGIEY